MGKFEVGQVVMWNRGKSKKRDTALTILEVIDEGELGSFYRIDRKNCLAEHMLRALTGQESGASVPQSQGRRRSMMHIDVQRYITRLISEDLADRVTERDRQRVDRLCGRITEVEFADYENDVKFADRAVVEFGALTATPFHLAKEGE
jgi:hypothetical protein